MKISVDDQLLEGDFAEAGTIADALRHVQASACAPGHIVVALRCDGENVPTNDMGATLAKSTSTLDLLEVFTGTPITLVLDAMTQALAALVQTEEGCQRVADLLTEGNTAEGIKTLGECLRVWQQIHDAVSQALQMLEIDSTQVTVNDEPLASLIARPKDVLVQVKQALESQDHVLLADIMQYEFETVTRQWHDIVSCLLQRAEELGRDTAEPS